MSRSIRNLGRDHNAADGACAVTVMICTGKNVAAKVHGISADGSQHTDGFSAGKYFRTEEVTFDNLSALLGIIAETAADPKQFIIRGRLRNDAPVRGDGLVRRIYRRQRDGEEPYFENIDRAWVMIDFDKVDNPEGLEPTSVAAMNYLQTLLPPTFHGVECVYSLSASAGLTNGRMISGHLWFVLDRPVSHQELKAWLSGYPVDQALFNPVQPHYIASPIFKDGRIDPIDERNGILPGHCDVVLVPEIDTTRATYTGRKGAGVGLEGAHGYEAKMGLLGDGDGLKGCHAVITSAIASYISQHGPSTDMDALKADIRARASRAPWDRNKHSLDYVAEQTSDEVLDRSIQDWVDKAFVQGEAYATSEMDDVNVAREKVNLVIDRFISSATEWHGRRGERQSLLRDGIGLFNVGKQYITDNYPPPRYGLAAQVGLGKTEAYISRLDDLVSFLLKGHCIFIGVSNHGLSYELKRRLGEVGIEAEIYLGPAQDDPDQSGETMCRIPEDLSVFQTAGISGKLCNVCPHRQLCGYQKQKSKKSSIWIGAHQLIYRKRKGPIPPVDFVIVDEDAVSAGVDGDNSQNPLLLRSDEVSDEMQKSMERLPLGVPLSRKDFTLSDRMLRDLWRTAYDRKQSVELPEGATPEQFDAALEIARRNSGAVLQAQFYQAILKPGPWGMRALKLDGGVIGLQWPRQRRIHKDFDVPIIFVDATLDPVAVERIIDVDRPPPSDTGAWIDEDGSLVGAGQDVWQPVIMGPVAEINAGTPHATYRQILFSGAASKFKGEETGAQNVARMRRYIEARSADFSRVLVICQLHLEQKLRELGLPPNVQIAHFNAIRGQDIWGNEDLLIVIGRTQPSPGAMELQAEALFHTAINTVSPEYYDRHSVPLTGANVMVQTERHPDPYAEIMRWQVCEAELIQAIGRVRAVNRSARNPVQVDIINLVPLPDIEIDELIEWNNARPDPGTVIAGRHGVLLPTKSAPGTANIAAALLPDLFETVNAAKQARMYSRAETPNKEYLLGVSAREYTSGSPPDIAPPVALQAPGCRYAVLAIALRAPTRRPLYDGEEPPKGADVNDEGVLSYGPVYVLKNIPRKLREKLV
jgi:hypothetical protein